ncbi:DUF6454 family protein [Sphingomonas aracearum]|uniref:Glutaminyl-peptide cyclotransferase n=1 Tax=Sphingomonas aracearum TaxID=2283317 RepID=A0A369VYB9_9SPHN|nr:DUF6454 family protein [Sphingomonas aracearum]RDE07298.1 hypothetical protein DVW87_06650 [Sphingomonas aracearum]
MIRTALFPLLLAFAPLSIAAAPETLDDGFEQAQLVGTLQLQGELFHVQGVEMRGDRIWVTSVDNRQHRGFLHEFDRAGHFLRRLELTDGARYHPGGLSVAGGSIWVPVAEMRPDSSAVLVEIDAQSLEVRRRIRVADHLGCVAASGRHLVAANWDSRQFYVLDLADKEPLRIVPNPSPTRFQDMKFVGDRLVAGGYVSWVSGAVEWLDWPTLRVRRTLRAGAVGPVRPFGRGGPLTGEGMAVNGRDLYVLPEDGPSRLFHFRLDETA